MSSTTTICDVDEFGRDLSLKSKQYEAIKFDFLHRFGGMSWADICDLIEDEEEQAEKPVEKKAKDCDIKRTLVEREEELLRSQSLVERKKLFNAGLYELEEGEVLDI